MLGETTLEEISAGPSGRATVVVAGVVEDGRASAPEMTLGTVLSVVWHTPADAHVVVLGDAGVLARIGEAPELAGAGGRVSLVACPPEAGMTSAVNSVLAAVPGGDVAVVMAGVTVSAGWLEGLVRAASGDTTVASSTPLSWGPGGVEIAARIREPEEREPSPANASLEGLEAPGETFGEFAARLRGRALMLAPRIGTIGPYCAYVRRPALAVAGPLAESLSLPGALADLALRLSAVGMLHVAADDVLIDGTPLRGAVRAAGAEMAGSDAVRETFDDDHRGPLQRAIGAGRSLLRPLSVAIDGRALISAYGGTQSYIIDLIRALASDGSFTLSVIVSDDLSELARGVLDELSVEVVSYAQVIDGAPVSDVVHRPQQVFTADDLALLRLVGKRIVIGHQDLIAYHNHAYHQDVERWRSYRRVTRMALAAADQVVFFSEHVLRDALSEELVSSARSHVIGVGAAAEAAPHRAQARKPDGLPDELPFMLCIGADYAHKNRPFAIALLSELRARGWNGRLALAGAHVELGSSAERERALLEHDRDLSAAVIELGPVDGAEQAWLYSHARALLYPTINEGFGLLPLEAAAWGLPCLYAPQASLGEFAREAATLLPWDVSASADAALAVLSDGPERDAHVSRLRSLPVPSWADVAEAFGTVYRQAVSDPPAAAAPRTWQELQREEYVSTLEHDRASLMATAQEYQDAYHAFEGRVAAGLPLIDEGGLLSKTQQRGLMRVASRRGIGPLLLAPFDLIGRSE
jgi:glycosyltransferase involved in cell wall biosynthesis